MSVPEATASARLPGLRRRISSMAYESLLLLGVLSVSFMLPHLALGMGFNIVLPGWILLSHVFIVLGAYFLWYWHHGGQTLAMQTWKIQLSTPCGARPSLARLALRYALAWPSVLYFGAGVLWALFDRDRQFLHDRLAGTRLVFKQGQSPSAPLDPP
ncbi:MAG: RDD family protein [Sulfuritalea sp.]|nr:RDD family protein [Sulfuritalea sp.]MDP1981176.1 RDD family protein [Sulfuritalea sp.]